MESIFFQDILEIETHIILSSISLGGYNMSIGGLTNSYIKSALDLMILNGEIQKMIIVIPEGRNYKTKWGHFFVIQVNLNLGDWFMDYFFDLVNYIDDHLQTK